MTACARVRQLLLTVQHYTHVLNESKKPIGTSQIIESGSRTLKVSATLTVVCGHIVRCQNTFRFLYGLYRPKGQGES